jgi:hypothetical protein
MAARRRTKATKNARRGRRSKATDEKAWYERRSFQGLVAAIGLFVLVTQVGDWIAKRTDDPPPARINAELSRVEVRKNMPLEDFLREMGEPTDRYSSARLQQLGNVVVVRASIQGFEGDTLPVRWSLYDAETETRLPAAQYNQTNKLRFRPRGPDQTGSGRLWVPLPGKDGSYFVRVTLEDERGRMLDERDTERFDVVALS